jgi:hypothetical protein
LPREKLFPRPEPRENDCDDKPRLPLKLLPPKLLPLKLCEIEGPLKERELPPLNA